MHVVMVVPVVAPVMVMPVMAVMPVVPVMAVFPMMMMPVVAMVALARYRLVGDFLGDQRLLGRGLRHVRGDCGRCQQSGREQRG
jgi:hypothetical protein